MHLKDARELAQELMATHGLAHWTFTFDVNVRRFGLCRFSARQIVLSACYTASNTPALVKDVMLHEIAHALGRPHEQHSPLWRIRFMLIGGSGDLDSDPDTQPPVTSF